METVTENRRNGDHNKKPKKKTNKKINGLSKSLFDRLELVIMFEDPTQSNDTIVDNYITRVLSSCSTSCRFPKDPLDVQAHRQATILPARTPYFNLPTLPATLPRVQKKSFFIQPTYPSITPLLKTANHAGIDNRQYHFVLSRNVIRKMTMNNENFVINVVRFGSTLYARCFSSYRTVDKNNVGFRFEKMCTSKHNGHFDYNQLIDAEVGGFKILMMGEVDAINKDNGESIELKCQKSNLSKIQEHEWWLQAYLTGTKSIIHGRHAEDASETFSHFKIYSTSELSDQQSKEIMFNRLYCVMQFLFDNVEEKKTYILRGYKDETINRRVMGLYEVVDKNDKEKLTFVNYELLRTFAVNK